MTNKIIIRIELEKENSSKEDVKEYLTDLIETDSLDYEIINNQNDFILTHSFGTLKDMGGLEWLIENY